MSRRRRRALADHLDEPVIRKPRSQHRAPETTNALRRLAAGRQTANDVVTLQRTLGNSAVQRALGSRDQATVLMRNGDEAPEATAADNPFFATNAPSHLFGTFSEMLQTMQKASLSEAASQVEEMFKQLDLAQDLAEKTRSEAEQKAAEEIVSAVAAAAAIAVVVSAARNAEVESGEKRPLLDAAIQTVSGIPPMAAIASPLTKAAAEVESAKADADLSTIAAFAALSDEMIKKAEEDLESSHKDMALVVEDIQEMLKDFGSRGAAASRA